MGLSGGLGSNGGYGGGGGGGVAGVSTFNTRAGAVTLSKADVTGTGLAAADVSADASGAAAAAQAAAIAASDASGSAATETTRAQTAEALLAPKASPALSGSPTAPTQSALDNSTKLATTAYGDAAVAVEKTRALAAEALAFGVARAAAGLP